MRFKFLKDFSKVLICLFLFLVVSIGLIIFMNAIYMSKLIQFLIDRVRLM